MPATFKSVLNSSNDIPTVAEPFTGVADHIVSMSYITAAIFYKSASTHTGTLFLEFSADGINWNAVDGGIEITALASPTDLARFPPRTLTVINSFFRIRYVPDDDNLTLFQLEVRYSLQQNAKLVSRLNQVITGTEDVELVRSIIAGQKSDGTFVNIGAGEGGVLFTSSFLIQVAEGNVEGSSLISGFGRNDDVDSAAGEDVWTTGGDYVFPSSASTLSVVSTSINDTSAGTGARTIIINGLDSNYIELSENVILDGTTPVVTSGSFLRVNNSSTLTAGSTASNEGIVSISHGGDVLSSLPVGENGSEEAIFTVPAGNTALLLMANMSPSKGANSSVTGSLRVREFGGVFIIKDNFTSHSSGFASDNTYIAPKVFSEKADFKFRVDNVTANNTEVVVRFDMLLAED